MCDKEKQCDNKPKLDGEDELGQRVHEIYSDGKSWMVYRNDKGVRVWTDDDADVASEALGEIGKDCAMVESKLHFLEERGGRHFGLQRDRVYSLVAKSITLRLLKQTEQAVSVIKDADSMMSTFIRRRTISQYLLGAFLAVAAFLLAAFCVNSMGVLEGYRCVFVFAALGGLLSVATGLHRLDPVLQGQRYINAVSGATRVCIAVVSGVLMYVALRGGVLPAELSVGSEDSAMHKVWFFVALAGFFEKLMPEVLGRMRQDTESR